MVSGGGDGGRLGLFGCEVESMGILGNSGGVDSCVRLTLGWGCGIGEFFVNLRKNFLWLRMIMF